MIEFAFGMASVAILLIGHCTRPTRARCGSREWLEGVRPSGLYDCRRVPIGDDTWDPIHGERDASVQPPGVIVGRIYCTAPAQPIACWDGSVRCEVVGVARR